MNYNKRQKIFERDGFKCKKCGSTADLTLDHIKPKSDGGTDSMDNLQTLCGTCNINKASFQKISLMERIKYIWNTFERAQSMGYLLKKELRIDLFEYATKQTVADKIKSMTENAEQKFVTFNLRLDTLTKTIETALSSKDKKDAIKFVELENKITLLETALEKERETYKLLTDYLKIGLVPEKRTKFIADAQLADNMRAKGFSEEDILKLEETKVEPAHFIKIKKQK